MVLLDFFVMFVFLVDFLFVCLFFLLLGFFEDLLGLFVGLFIVSLFSSSCPSGKRLTKSDPAHAAMAFTETTGLF